MVWHSDGCWVQKSEVKVVSCEQMSVWDFPDQKPTPINTGP